MKKRIAAEWEPVVGVMVAWPLHLPYTILADFSKDDKLFVLTETPEDRQAAAEALECHGVHMANTSFIVCPRSSDAWWPRDWGPHPLFNEDGKLTLASALFMNSDPNSTVEADSVLYNPFDDTYYAAMEEQGQHMENAGAPLDGTALSPLENAAISIIAPALGFDYVKLPIVLTGGNIMSDGRGSMISTAVLVNENKFMGVPAGDFFRCAQRELGVDSYSVISNYEDFGIQHIDCFLKMVDEETLIVTRAPKDHPYYRRFEDIVDKQLRKLRSCYGGPYRIFRVDAARFDGDDLTAYANSYILNKKVYVPMYGVKQDGEALGQWQAAMPGYEIKGFTYNYSQCSPQECLGVYETETGWSGFDVIHCRTKSVWDKGMLYMSVRRLPQELPTGDGYDVDAHIVAYSGAELIPESLTLCWRLAGESSWNILPLTPSCTNEHFSARIPPLPAGSQVEYYVHAKDRSGREETMPRVAPKGVYKSKVI